MKILSRITGLFSPDRDNEVALSFWEELNRQCRTILVPVCLLSMVSWLPYIETDEHMHGGNPLLVLLRLGLTVVGTLAMIVRAFPFGRKTSYHILFGLICYMELSAAAILGLVGGDPVYMGGFCILILILPMMPFTKMHSLILLAATLVLFIITGTGTSGLSFINWDERYGLLNFIAAVLVSIVAIFLLDTLRRRGYNKSRLIQQRNEELLQSALKINYINEELEASAAELAAKNEELKRANEIKSDLLGMAAHDLKNPLQVITGYTELLQKKMKENPFVSDKLVKIHQSSDKMLKLITGLLESASISDGKLTIKELPVAMDELTNQVVNVNRQLAIRKEQAIDLTVEENCFVTGDEMLLQEVMDNLISNAIKFSPPGKIIWVSLSRIDTEVIFKVRDEGPGFTPEDKQKIFRKYQKLSARPTGGESSTGLGLSIIRELVELHKGNVTVESEVGQGSTFSVHLPAAG